MKPAVPVEALLPRPTTPPSVSGELSAVGRTVCDRNPHDVSRGRMLETTLRLDGDGLDTVDPRKGLFDGLAATGVVGDNDGWQQRD